MVTCLAFVQYLSQILMCTCNVKYATYLFIYLFTMCTQKLPGILVLVQTHASGRHV